MPAASCSGNAKPGPSPPRALTTVGICCTPASYHLFSITGLLACSFGAGSRGRGIIPPLPPWVALGLPPRPAPKSLRQKIQFSQRGGITPEQADAPHVQCHYKNLLEVEEAFCELKSYLKVRPVFHYKPERVINHVRICFLACWISARLATQWRTCGETGEVTRILRELQTIRLGQISVGKPGCPFLVRLTKVPAHLNALLAKINLLPLFAAPPKWAAFPAEAQP